MNWIRQLFRPGLRAVTIRGGLVLPRNKPGLPDVPAVKSLGVPSELVTPLYNYQRDIATPLVKIGDAVKVGEQLASGVIACANGVVTAIEKRPIIHPSQRRELCVVIACNGNGNFFNDDTANGVLEVHGPVHPAMDVLTLERMESCGIVGLGGAGFSTVEKFRAGYANFDGIDTLLINAVECEPMISCDEALMMTCADDIIGAILALISMTGCHRCILAIENDKLQAIAQITRALDAHRNSSESTIEPGSEGRDTANPRTAEGLTTFIELLLLAPVYPSGAERPLIERVTGSYLSGSDKPADHGIVCINVATALAARRAQLGYPLTSRIVTIAGALAQNPTNVRIKFGTSIADALHMSGNADYPEGTRIRVGGPLSGFDIDDLNAPITATTNCIAVEAPIKPTAPLPCIRCGACSNVCPVDLLPQQLFWYAKGDDFHGAARFGLGNCIECGCCDVVCPSSIALTQTFRYARGAIREQNRQAKLATLAEQRFAQREQRQAIRVRVRDEKRKTAQTKLQTSSDDPIADALKRAQQRRRPGKKTRTSTTNHKNSDGDPV